MTAVAYLRKSRSDDPTKEVSEDVQRGRIEAMAARDGVTISTWYRDWDRSADEAKVSRRIDFAKMMRAIEAGQVTTVYALAADRLYRSVETYVRLTSAASQNGVKIVTDREGIIGGDGSPLGEFQAGLGALLGKLELSTAKVRAKGAYDARVARGDYVGQAPYGSKLVKVDGIVRLEADADRPVAPILNAVERADGKVRTAIRIINDELKIAAPYGGHWDRKTLLRVIEREAPHLLAARAPSGRREAPATPALFAKLLRCHCGATMTPNRHRERRRQVETVAVSYYCAKGNASPANHRPYYVAESKLLPIIRAEADRLTPPSEVRAAEADAAIRSLLIDKRKRLGLAFASDAFDEPTFKAELRKINDELRAIDEASRTIPILRPVDWENWTTAEINTVLRAIFAHVEVGHDLMPVAFTWNYPAWRAPTV
jgi:DNA invertase Pin-like site-specific DNA recombinase